MIFHPGRGRILLAGAAAIAAVSLTACGSASSAPSGSSSSASSLKGVTLNVGIFQTVTIAEVKASGLFSKTPYKIKWDLLNGSAETLPALESGAIDLSWGLSDTATPLAAADAKTPWTAKTAPFKIVALLKPYDPAKYPAEIVAAYKGTGIKSLAGLRGHTYAYSPGGNANAIALLALYKAGLTKADVQVTLLQNDSLASAVSSGAVDAATVEVPQVTAQLADGTVKQIATAAQVGFPDFDTITAGTDALDKPALSAAIGDFTERAAKFEKWADTHIDAVAKAYETNEQLTPAEAVSSANNAAVTLIPVGPSDPGTKAELKLTSLLYKAGFLPKPVDEAPFLDDRYEKQIEAGNG